MCLVGSNFFCYIAFMNENDAEEIKILLKKNISISEENHRLLRGLRNSARLHSFFRLIYLIILIGLAFWSYNYFKPYFDQVRGTYDTYQKNQSKIMDTLNSFKVPR